MIWAIDGTLTDTYTLTETKRKSNCIEKLLHIK